MRRVARRNRLMCSARPLWGPGLCGEVPLPCLCVTLCSPWSRAPRVRVGLCVFAAIPEHMPRNMGILGRTNKNRRERPGANVSGRIVGQSGGCAENVGAHFENSAVHFGNTGLSVPRGGLFARRIDAFAPRGGSPARRIDAFAPRRGSPARRIDAFAPRRGSSARGRSLCAGE